MVSELDRPSTPVEVLADEEGPFGDRGSASSHTSSSFDQLASRYPHNYLAQQQQQQYGYYSGGASPAAERRPTLNGSWTPGGQTPGGAATPSGAMTPSSSWHGHTAAPGFMSPSMSTGSASGSHTPTSSWGQGLSHTRSMSGTMAALAASQSGPAMHDQTAPMNIRQRKFFKSRILPEGETPYKPWLENKARRKADLKAYWIFVIGCFLGIAAAAGVIYSGVAEVPKHSYCLVLDEEFSGTTLNTDIWFRELETGGFGNNEFEWTTSSENNSYVANGNLYIVPTLTSDSLGDAAITNGYTLNLTADGTCTAANKTDDSCAVASNSSTGVVLPPIQSARLITNFSTTIKYGRVEVRAKMPTGDWIWPAVWMMPKDSVYGSWPRSGEIDIFEGKGNLVKNKNADGTNRMRSTLHWGPNSDYDGYLKTTNNRQLFRDYYDQEYHTFGLEWTPEGIYMWEDTPVHQVMSYKWKKDFWTEGDFPSSSSNGTTLTDPWPTSDKAAPFDQEFFLILSVAVGGTNGYFEEDTVDKPWSNNDENARATFWAAKDEWYPTWPTNVEDRAMVVDYVKMWNMEGVEGHDCPASPLT